MWVVIEASAVLFHADVEYDNWSTVVKTSDFFIFMQN